MIIAEINTLAHGSTGKIMLALADVARRNGETVYTYSAKNYRRTGKNSYLPIDGHTYYAGELSNILHKCFAQVTGLNGWVNISYSQIDSENEAGACRTDSFAQPS